MKINLFFAFAVIISLACPLIAQDADVAQLDDRRRHRERGRTRLLGASGCGEDPHHDESDEKDGYHGYGGAHAFPAPNLESDSGAAGADGSDGAWGLGEGFMRVYSVPWCHG